MSGQEIGTVVGGIIGAYFGYPQLGMAIGGLIGGAIDPTKISGPHIGQGQQQTSTDGVPIAWVIGTAKVAGCLIAVGPRREVKVESGGKGGGPVQVTYEAHQDFAFLVCESCELRDSTIESIILVEQDGKIVYDSRPDSNFANASAKWKTNVDFYFGAEDQMPHPTLEAIFGTGKTPAYRGSLIAVFKDFNLTPFGDRIPSYLFTVSSNSDHADPVILAAPETYYGNSFGAQTGGYMWERTETFALPDGPTEQIEITKVNFSDTARVTLTPLYVETTDSAPATHAVDVDDLNSSYIFDTGWNSNNSFGPLDPNWSDWWASHGSSAPAVNYPVESIDYAVVLNAPAGKKIRGIRKNTFVFSSGNYIDNYDVYLKMCTAPSGIMLTYMTNGAYRGSDDVYYKAPWSSFEGGGTDTVNPVPLSDAISRICKRGGLAATAFDSSALSLYEITGYPIATQCAGTDALLPLLQTAFAFGTAVDNHLLFKFYGEDVIVSVNDNDAVINDASDGAIQKTVRNQATEFPQKIVGQYIDPAQNYNTVAQQAERLTQTVVATGESDIQIPLAITAIQAKQAVDKALKVAYATLEGTIDLSVPYATASADYLTLAAGEPIFQDNKRWVTDEVDIGINYLKISGRYDRQSAYTSNVQPVTGNTPTPPVSMYSGPTDMMVMNLPSLRTQDTYGVYITVKGEDASWRGANIQVSYDDQQSWQNALTATLESVMGTVVSDMASSSSSDEADTLVAVGEDELSSVTDSQLAVGANPFAIVDNSDLAEVRQAKYATLQPTSSSDSDNEYLLTRQNTGLLGTEFVLHGAGEKFTMLDKAYFFPIDLSFKGKTLYFRAIGFGEIAEDQSVVSLVYNPDTTVIVDGGEITGS